MDLRHDLAGGAKHYYAESFRSDALLPYDAPNGFPVDVHTLCEPVGVMRVRLRCPPDGDVSKPVISIPLLNAKSAFITATLQTPTAFPCAPPSRDLLGSLASPRGALGTIQASARFTPPSGSGLVDVMFLVRAGRSYTVDASFVTGDAAGDIAGTVSATTSVVLQGQVVEVDMVVPPVYCDGGLGCDSAIGRLGVLGTSVFLDCLGPSVNIYHGPLGAARSAVITPDAPGGPAGSYKFRSVLPSTFPAWSYSPYDPKAVFSFQTPGGHYETMELLWTPIPFDCADPLEDLRDLFVVDPAFVKGRIRLEGPDCGAEPSCLQSIAKAGALTNGLTCTADHFWGPPASEGYVSAKGWGRAQGDVYASIKGQAISPTLWSGSYEMWLGALNREKFSTWSPGFLTLPITGGGLLQITDGRPTGLVGPPPNVEAGQSYINDHDYCLSEIDIEFVNLGGVPIARPGVSTQSPGGLGSYTGPDPLHPGQITSYSVYAGFAGTPLLPHYTTGNVNVRMCLPQADGYLLVPSVSYLIGGEPGSSQFQPFPLNVACKQCIHVEVTTNGVGPIIKLTNTVNCTSLSEYTLEGAVCASKDHVLRNVSYVLNGAPSVTLCSGASCGAVFNLGGLSLPLLPCKNTVTLSAKDDQGLTGSITFTVIRDSAPPTLFGCTNVVMTSRTSSHGATASYGVSAVDDCDPSPGVTCVPPPGLFPVGTTAVRCTAVDQCGNSSECGFTVTVLQCLEVVEERFGCEGGDAISSYRFCVRNNSSDPLGYLTLVDLPPGVSATPYFIPLLPPLPPGQVRCVTVALSGLEASTNFCFRLLAHRPDFEECCMSEHCAAVAPPRIVCPEDVVVSCVTNDVALVSYSLPAVVSGGCSPNITVTCVPPPGLFPIGVTLVTCTATDAAGHSGQCTFKVTVGDTELQMFECPQSVTVTNCLIPQLMVSASDNCTASNRLVFTQTPRGGTPAGPGTFVVTTRVCDRAGNCRDCDTVVTLVAPRVKHLTLNTGTDTADALLPAGSPEGRLQNVGGPVADPFVVVSSNSLPALWVNDSSRSAWIAPTQLEGPAGSYTNRWEFDLPCTNATIVGRFATDDAGLLFLNGTLVAGPTPPLIWNSITIHGGFVLGLNSLEIVASRSTGGAVGLRAELEVWTECCLESQPVSTNCCTRCVPPFLSTFTIRVEAGLNYLVNPLCHGEVNTVDTVLGRSPIPDGTELLVLDKAGNSFTSDLYDLSGSGGWGNPSQPLEPGVGFILRNPGEPFTLTFTGCEPQCPPRCPPTNQVCFVGRTGSATLPVRWEDLFNCPPKCGSLLHIFNNAIGSYDTYTLLNSGWTPAAPVWQAGVGVLVSWQPDSRCSPCTNELRFACAVSSNYVFNWCDAVEGQTICLDLANLPANLSGGATDLIAAMNQHGFLDFTAGNQSAVDWITLEVTSCCCHEDIVVANSPGACSAVVQYVPPRAGDGCSSNITLNCTPPPGVFPVGTTTVTCIATNEVGQSAPCTFRVTVLDIEPPVLVCPETALSTNCLIPQILFTVSDNCTSSNQLAFTQTPPANTPAAPGTYRVTTRVCDSSGNCIDCDTVVTVTPCDDPGGPGSPLVGVELGSGGAVLRWSGGWILQSAPGVTGPWIEVPGASSP